MVTLILTLTMCALLFLMIWSATYFYPWTGLLRFFPKDIEEKARLHQPLFPAAPVIVWILIVLAILALVIGVAKAKAGSTDADQVLTVAEQAAQIVSRLEEHSFSYEVNSLTYEHVSHFAIPMRRNTWLLKLLFQSERQFPEACAAERADLSGDHSPDPVTDSTNEANTIAGKMNGKRALARAKRNIKKRKKHEIRRNILVAVCTFDQKEHPDKI